MFIVVFLSSCLKQEDFPNRPDIEFIEMTLNYGSTSITDSLGIISFNFTDGDGNLGVDDVDTLNYPFRRDDPYHFNLFIRYFEKRNGEFEEFVIQDPPLHARFQRLTSAGVGNAIEGRMDAWFGARPGSPYDTVRYEVYIVDRELQHSDTIVTPEVVLSELGF